VSLDNHLPEQQTPGFQMKKKPSKKKMTDICHECGARCCRYMATEIDEPSCKKDYDHIRWYLMHENIHVFFDHEGDWFLEVESRCEHLGPDGRCMNYKDRPRICRNYGDDRQTCEYLAEEEPFERRFSTAPEFEAWLEEQMIKWRFKKR